MLEEAVRILKLVNRRALVGDEPLAVHQEFVLLGFAAKDGMVLEDQAAGSRRRLPGKKQGGSEPADPSTDDDTVIGFAGVDQVFGEGIVGPIADGVAGLHHFECVSVRGAVFADTAVAGEVYPRLAPQGWQIRATLLRRQAARSRGNRGA